MKIIEKLAHKIAEKISLQLNYNEERKAVIAYGLIGISQMISIFIIISIFGVLFDFWYESVLIYIGVGLMRKSTGGAHSKTMKGCIIISVLSITILSAVSRYILDININIWINVGISGVIFILCFIIYYFRVPVDNPNKPIVDQNKILRLRKQSFIKLIMVFLFTLLFVGISVINNRFYSIATSLRLAILWQLLTLTKTGIYILDKIDFNINCIMVKDKV